MADTLFVRFKGDEFEWLVFDASGRKKFGGSGPASQLNDDLEQPFEGRAVLVVPGEEVLLTTAMIPTRQLRQILQAVPYAIEEQLAVDVEDCFFALGSRNAQDRIQVAVVDRSHMKDWLVRADSIEADIGFMVSETSLVPSGDGIAVLLDNERAHVRWPDGTGITTGRETLPLALSLGPAELHIQVSGNEADLGAARMQVGELEASGEELDERQLNDSGFHQLCCEHSGTEIDLLQGEFKVVEAVSSTQLVWRSVAALAVIAVVLHLATVVGQGWYFDRKSVEYESEARALYASVFPNDRNVRDLRRRWNAHLGRSDTGSNEFISLFAAASRGLPGAGLSLNNVNFNESRGDLILQVIGKRSEELVQFTQVLTGEGLDAEIGTINQDGGTVRGSIKIRSRGGGS